MSNHLIKHPPKENLLNCNPTNLFESNGELFIVGNGTSRVYKLLRNGHLVVIAGGGDNNTGDGQPAHQSKLLGPFGICVSQRNEVFITEKDGNRIRKIDKDGNIQTIAGTGNLGDNGDGFALNCDLSGPTGIIVNELDQIIFVDGGNNKIRMVRPDGMLKTIVHYEKTLDFSPEHLCLDERCGNIYLSKKTEILKLLPNGNFEIVPRKPSKQKGTFAEQRYHKIIDVKTRNGIIYYSDRSFLRKLDQQKKDQKDGNDSAVARLESVQRLMRIISDPYLAICPSSGGFIYMSDRNRGTLWKAEPTTNLLKEFRCKHEIPFNFEEYPHVGPRNQKKIVRCCEFHDITLLML